MRNLQPVDERESRDIFTVVRDLGELILKEVDIRVEAVALPHLDREEVMVVPLGLLARGILSEEHFSYFLKVADREGRKRVEPF